jgi:hypothetical protein
MSTKDQRFSAMLHGEALLRARRPELDPLITELRELAADRDDIRTECAGTIAGSWFASPGTEYGHELIAAGLLLMSGPVDRDLLKESTPPAGASPAPPVMSIMAEAIAKLAIIGEEP